VVQAAVSSRNSELSLLCLRGLLHVPFTDTLITTFQKQCMLPPPGAPASLAPRPTITAFVRAISKAALPTACTAPVRAAAAELLQAWARRAPQLAAGSALVKPHHRLSSLARPASKVALGPEKRAVPPPRVFPRERKIAMPEAVALGMPLKDSAATTSVWPPS
jgi:hypothetical protein